METKTKRIEQLPDPLGGPTTIANKLDNYQIKDA
jgi:hypothetical protein